MSTSVRQTSVVADPTRHPYSTVLKMFFSHAGGNSLGSAVVVGRRAVLMSGGHAYSDGRWASHAEFIPRYANGAKPFGTFTSVKMTTLKEYVELPHGPNLAYDLAACVVDRDFPTELGVADIAGGISRILVPGKLRSVGFPAQPRLGFNFNGQQMWESVGDYHHEDDRGFRTTSPRTFAHFNDFTGGATGGPIFTVGPNSLLVGLNSHVLLSGGQPEQPPRMHSPYFGEHVWRLMHWLKENGGEPSEPPAPMPPLDLSAQLQATVAELSALIARLPD